MTWQRNGGATGTIIGLAAIVTVLWQFVAR